MTCLDYEFQRGSRQHKLSALSKPWRLRLGGGTANLHCSLSAFEIGHLCALHWLSALGDVVNIWVSKLCVCAVGFQNEIFASRHQDENSVACIEDKCYVLTLAQYCRWVLCYLTSPASLIYASLLPVYFVSCVALDFVPWWSVVRRVIPKVPPRSLRLATTPFQLIAACPLTSTPTWCLSVAMFTTSATAAFWRTSSSASSRNVCYRGAIYWKTQSP